MSSFSRKMKPFSAYPKARYKIATYVLQMKIWYQGIKFIIKIEKMLKWLKPKKTKV